MFADLTDDADLELLNSTIKLTKSLRFRKFGEYNYANVITYKVGNYIIEVFDAKPNYTDLINQYNAIYIDDSEYQPSSVVGVKIFREDEISKQVALGATGGPTGIFESSIIVNEENIAICCADSIFCLSIPELKLLWNTKVDTATAFQIFKHGRDYIVHGELEISRISEYGEITWQRSGADIFVSLEGKEDDFTMTDEYILATDWDGRKYKFDFNGNIIE